MIKIQNVSKTFGKLKSLDNVSASIKEKSIFGLIGSNGSGKSTLMRVMCGIFKPDEGSVTYDDIPVWENIDVKNEIVYISDELYFFPHSSFEDMMRYYNSVYRNFSKEKFYKLAEMFSLSPDRKVATMSKGMQKQAAIIMALASRPKYLLCDETFDGLDPVARQVVKRLLASEVADNGMTPIIASHNLRELEDICDHVGLLHKGGILFEKELDDMKLNIHKIQLVVEKEITREEFPYSDILSFSKRGSVYTIVARGNLEAIEVSAKMLSPVFFEAIPLTLEEIFISEMEDRGYDFSKVIF